ERIKARGSVTKRATPDLDDVLEALLSIRLDEGGPLERPEFAADAHLLEVVEHGFGEAGIRAVAVIFAGVEALRVARLDQQSLGLDRIVGRSWQLPVVFENVRNDAASKLGLAERQSLIDGVAVDSDIRGAPHPLVMPRRLRVPLVGEVEPEGGLADD